MARVSGVADHFAQDDEHAISITRSIIANLNLRTIENASAGDDESAPVRPPRQQWDEPLFDPREMGSIIPADPKKPFDVRKASCGGSLSSGLEHGGKLKICFSTYTSSLGDYLYKGLRYKCYVCRSRHIATDV